MLLRRGARPWPLGSECASDLANRSASCSGSDLGSTPTGSPLGSSRSGGPTTPPAHRLHRPSVLKTMLLALLPTLVLVGTIGAMHQRHSRHSLLADEMLAAHTGSAVAGHGARQLSEAAAATPPAVAAAHACAEALQIPQVCLSCDTALCCSHRAVARHLLQCVHVLRLPCGTPAVLAHLPAHLISTHIRPRLFYHR